MNHIPPVSFASSRVLVQPSTTAVPTNTTTSTTPSLPYRHFGEMDTLSYQNRLADIEHTVNLVRYKLRNAQDSLRQTPKEIYYPLDQMQWSLNLLNDTTEDLRRTLMSYRTFVAY